MDDKQIKAINKVNLYLVGLIILMGFCFSTTATASGTSADTSATVAGEHFRITYQSKVEPLPLNRIHSWILHVETLDGKPVGNAEITVHGGMPAHKHGLPTEPAITEIGDGDYLVEGIKFSMTGEWQFWFNVRAGQASDEVKFDIKF